MSRRPLIQSVKRCQCNPYAHVPVDLESRNWPVKGPSLAVYMTSLTPGLSLQKLAYHCYTFLYEASDLLACCCFLVDLETTEYSFLSFLLATISTCLPHFPTLQQSREAPLFEHYHSTQVAYRSSYLSSSTLAPPKFRLL